VKHFRDMVARSRGGESLFERTLEALPDGVLLTDASRGVIYANRAFARHWRIPQHVVDGGDDSALLMFAANQIDDQCSFRVEVERLHMTGESLEDELKLKDGRIMSRRSVPFHEKGEVTGRIWIFSDVTEARNATIDALTGLPNRRAYSRLFPAFALAADDGFLRSVAMMDVDNFKIFNDSYGHAAGDVVLSEIGRIIRSHFGNADDLVFRIGGEESLMASKARSAARAIELFDRVRRSIADMETAHAGNAPHDNVTVSMGLGTFRGPRDPGEVFDRVDAALYQAKAAGRNIAVPVAI
jgi:diguanylate cyclase (GGDEF)-like protein